MKLKSSARLNKKKARTNMEKETGIIKCSSHEDWLSKRRIGGSDASVILDENPYRNKQQLYREIKDIEQAKDISDKPYVKFGKRAEEHIRALFALKNEDDFEVIDPPSIEKDGYIELLYRKDKPYLTATLDGRLVDKKTGARGAIEIKTADVIKSSAKEKWKDGVPNNYYDQLLHYFVVDTSIQFVVLVAFLSYTTKEGDERATLRAYLFTRELCQNDIEMLENAETDYWENYILKDIEPPLRIAL